MNPVQSVGPARPAQSAPYKVPNFQPIAVADTIPWGSVGTEAIRTGDNLPIVDIPSRLVDLIARCWKSANINKGHARSGLHVGANKPQPVVNSWKPEDIIAARKYQERTAPYVKAVNPTQPIVEKQGGLFDDLPSAPAAKQGIANDWTLMQPLQRISAFTFRGDSRGPAEIAGANGFFPPVTRDDAAYVNGVVFPQFENYMLRRFQVKITREQFNHAYASFADGNKSDIPFIQAYFVWRALVQQEAFHIPRMVVFEALKGYISTSRAVSVAWEFSSRKNGWVYLTRVRGGYLIPTAAEANWVGNYEREHEVACPGHLPWDDIFAFRKTGSPKFTGPLYVRNGLRETYPAAFERILRAFSII